MRRMKTFLGTHKTATYASSVVTYFCIELIRRLLKKKERPLGSRKLKGLIFYLF